MRLEERLGPEPVSEILERVMVTLLKNRDSKIKPWADSHVRLCFNWPTQVYIFFIN